MDVSWFTATEGASKRRVVQPVSRHEHLVVQALDNMPQTIGVKCNTSDWMRKRDVTYCT